ncbi:rhodanese-like domain-containing protein [Priestia flexa]|uniref:rhodanese-like domain-containing protein n=1 Tax=Priestia flexa TaxID=86664 RepID=UPI001B33C28F|nr:rhodanese-like domain-containing protein [Priestia flexa]
MILLYIGVSLFCCAIMFSLYNRHVPVHGIKKLSTLDCETTEIAVVDVRHFHEMKHKPCQKAIHIPLPYLERQHVEIPSKQVVVIAPDTIARNLSIRKLQKYGYQVKGYCCACEG